MADANFTLTQNLLFDLFEYRDGQLIRKKSQGNRTSGTLLGCSQKNGYVIGMINKKFFYLHRLIYLWHHGYMPKTVDHIDGNPGNNKIENLRACTQSQNLCNKTKQINNSSGHKNVYWANHHQRWIATVNYKGKKHTFGSFKNLEDAVLAAQVGREKIHGQFAKA